MACGQPAHGACALLLLAVLVGGGLRFDWSRRIPYNFAPDEHSHYCMAEYLRVEHRPPTMADVPDRIPVSYPALCPLGYLPCALAGMIAPTWEFHHRSARLGNVVVGALTILAGYLAVRALLPGSVATAVAVAWFLALQPQLVFVNAYVNNDSAMILFSVAACGAWGSICRAGPTLPRYLLAGVATGLAVACKANALILVAVGGLAFLADTAFRWHHATHRRWLRHTFAGSGTCLAGFALPCLPWALWSLRAHASWWGLEIHQAWWFAYLRKEGIVQGFLTLERLDGFLAETWASFWGAALYSHQALGQAASLGVAFVLGVAATGWWSQGARLLAGVDARGRATLAIVGVGTCLLAFAAHVHHSLAYGYQPQGRYLLPAILPVGLLLTLGLAGAVTRGRGERGLARSIAIGGGVVVGGLICLQSLTIGAYDQQLVGPTRDRRITTRILAFGTSLPRPPARALPPLEPLGSTRLRVTQNTARLLLPEAGDGVRTGKYPAEAAAYLAVDFHKTAGDERLGTVDVRQPRETACDPSRRLHFLDHPVGLMRYRFDVRRLANAVPGGVVEFDICFPPGTEGTLWRVVVLDREGAEVEPTTDGPGRLARGAERLAAERGEPDARLE